MLYDFVYNSGVEQQDHCTAIMDGWACDKPYHASGVLYKLLASLLFARISAVLNLHLLDFSIELSHAFSKLLLLIPHEGAFAGEQEVDLLECAAGSLGEETVDNRDVNEHGGTEDVEGLRR